MRVKGVTISEYERFVICHNPEAADRDAAIRARLLASWRADRRHRPAHPRRTRQAARDHLHQARAQPVPARHRHRAAAHRQTAIRTETNLDGKYLLRSSDPTLSAEDIALGYKQLLEVERGWRDMKQIIDLRPIYHRLEDRIRAHVLLCWLALLLIRIIETTTNATWNTLAAELRACT